MVVRVRNKTYPCPQYFTTYLFRVDGVSPRVPTSFRTYTVQGLNRKERCTELLFSVTLVQLDRLQLFLESLLINFYGHFGRDDE